MSIATIGSSVEVWVYSSAADRKNEAGGGPVHAVITSDGPPKVAAWRGAYAT